MGRQTRRNVGFLAHFPVFESRDFVRVENLMRNVVPHFLSQFGAEISDSLPLPPCLFLPALVAWLVLLLVAGCSPSEREVEKRAHPASMI